ncbi:MAG: putative signal transducing protein [Rhodothermales bacterium]
MSEETVVIRTFTHEWEATLARDFLEAAGIRAFVDTVGRDFLPQVMGGTDVHSVRLVVLQSEAERAEEALQAFEKS